MDQLSTAQARLARRIHARSVRSATGTMTVAVVAGAPAAGLVPVYLDGDTTTGVPARRLRGPMPATGDRVVVWRRGRWLLIVGRVSTADAGETPWATAAGSVDITLAAAATNTANVTFPTGRFTVAPIVTLGKSAVLQTTIPQAGAVTDTGFTARLSTGDGGNVSGTATVYWRAVQMTPTSAEG